jgi:MFS transporter, AAHS family, 4-hydroxybenzoate transporter
MNPVGSSRVPAAVDDDSPIVDVASCIDGQPISRLQWRVFGTAMAIALLDGLDVQVMGVAAPALARAWQLKPEALAPVFTAAPAGMLVGALIMGRLADHLGRKRPLIAATLLFATGTVLTAIAPTLHVMMVLRFLTGIGLGGVLPNLVSLVIELTPNRLRGRVATCTFSALPFGAMLAGVLARWLIPTYGWASVFWIGGALPIVMACLAAMLLPESIRFLALHRDRHAEALGILRQIAPRHAFPSNAMLAVSHADNIPASAATVWGPGHGRTTALLVVVAMLNMFMLYFTLNWLPMLLERAGLSHERALLATVLINTGGGLGALTWGLLIDRFGGVRTMATAGIAASVGLTLLGLGHQQPALLGPTLFIAGACIMGALPGLYVVIASCYPTRIRSTGIGVVLGAGRGGAVLGPAVGGLLMTLDWPLTTIFIAVGSLGLLWASGLYAIGRLPE